jgi:hypothetical protein
MNGIPLQPIRTSPTAGLRLVFPDHGPNLVEARQRHAVASENRAAASLTATPTDSPSHERDVRRILALTTAQALEGGRAAILRPDRRRKLVSTATRLGLRPFEANLVIAIVQDGARRGLEPTAASESDLLNMIPATPAAQSRSASQRSQTREQARLALTALLVASTTLVMLINWITG